MRTSYVLKRQPGMPVLGHLARPLLVLCMLASCTAPAITPVQEDRVVRTHSAGLPRISWDGAESVSLSTYKWMGGPILDSGGVSSNTAPVRVSIVEQRQPPAVSVTHLHETEFVFALDGASVLDWQGRFPEVTIGAGAAAGIDVTGAQVTAASPFRGPHTHRNDTPRVVRWYAIRLIGAGPSGPLELFPESRTLYVSPSFAPDAIASGHVGELRLLTMSQGSQTPRHRPTFRMVAFVLAGIVDAQRDSGSTRLNPGEGLSVGKDEIVSFAARGEISRLLVFFVSASGQFQEDLD